MTAAAGVGAGADVGRWESEGGDGVDVARLVAESETPVSRNGDEFVLRHGAVVIAAITSCTNTSNPSVMVAAGLVAKKAVELGLTAKPWVKTSLAPGSKVVTDYLAKADLQTYLDQLQFNVVGIYLHITGRDQRRHADRGRSRKGRSTKGR